MLVLLACSQAMAAGPKPKEAEEQQGAPFLMCPSGKPELLVGGIEYEAPSALAFDSRNRPYIFHTRDAETCGYILTLRDGKWAKWSYLAALRRAHPKFTGFLARPGRPQLHALGTMTIDDADGLHAIIRIREGERRTRPVLIYSPDLCETFQAYALPGRPSQAFLETRVGHNDLAGPPAVGLLRFRKPHPAQWTAYYVFSVAVPVKKGRRLEWPPAVEVAQDCFGISNHSGGYSFAVTAGRKTHLVYAEIPPEGKVGNPTYAATYDREQRKVLARQFLATAPPRVPDVHSTPVIAADSKGHLHVVAGAHGQSFLYLRSLRPGRVDGGWTKPVPVGVRQTYATLICDANDTLHAVFREWRHCATLCYQTKPAAGGKWSASVPLVYAPGKQRGYGIFYHRVFLDRAGAIYVSFTFNAQRGGRYPRALIVSEDGGRSWRLATTQTFRRRVREATP